MEPKFYVGNFILNVGIPYIIISQLGENWPITFERIKIIDYYDNEPYFSMEKIFYQTGLLEKEDLIKAEIETCKRVIFEEINKKLIEKSDNEYFNINLNFCKSERSVLFHLVDKYETLFGDTIIKKTNNEKLRTYIHFCFNNPITGITLLNK